MIAATGWELGIFLPPDGVAAAKPSEATVVALTRTALASCLVVIGVVLVVGMAVRTVGTPLRSRAPLSRHVAHVFSRRSRPEMQWIATRRIVTTVSDAPTRWYRAIKDFVYESVSLEGLTV